MDLQHIALGTKYCDGKVTRLDAPWEVYAVGDMNKLPHPFYELRIVGGEVFYRFIHLGSNQYNKVFKWVKGRGIFTAYESGCLVSLERGLELLAQNEVPQDVTLH